MDPRQSNRNGVFVSLSFGRGEAVAYPLIMAWVQFYPVLAIACS